MKDYPVAVVNYYAAPSRKRAVCISITRALDNLTVRGTAWDEDISIAGDGIYYTSSGGSVSDVEQSAALSVDNSELRGNFDAITTEDLQAGLWAVAEYSLFVVNPDAPDDGKDVLMAGPWGLQTIDRLSWVAELRGRMQSLQQSFGELIAAACPYDLGDANCKRSLTDLTVTGTADSVSADGLTWTDAARTEPGPAGGAAIVSIARGTTTTITMGAPLGVPDGGTVTLSAMDGMELLSGVHIVRNPTGNAFDILVDTTDTGVYPNFVSGTATPMGAESGYFDYGRMTILDVGSPSIGNAGITREVKSYVEGEWTLQQAFPFAVTGLESYRLIAGCDKLETTCRVKFNNLANNGGEPKVPGNDLMVQVGRQE